MTATAAVTDSSTVKELSQTVDDLQETVAQQTEIIEEQANQIDELKSELAARKDHIGREIADVRARLTEVENQQAGVDTADETSGCKSKNEDSRDKQTPLETICSFPEHLSARELSANQERARFIAKDVRDYAEKVPAGLVIDSTAIKRVLTAKENTRPHTQTVARVMEFFDEFGKNSVALKKRRGAEPRGD